ncbi:MAG: hypothetical protein V3V08_05155 [Nannocystaceae bacterium]
MRRFSYLIISAVTAGSLVGCQRPAPQGDNSEVLTKLDEITKKLASLEEKVGKAGARAKPKAGRPRPDPKTVYSVAVGEAPYKGAEHAKVTVVEAFEYA